MSRVLLIDADVATLSTLRASLRCAGYAVETSSSGHEALESLARQQYHAAIAELRLPDMSGLDVLAQLRERDRELSVIITFVSASTADALEAGRLGACGFVKKPVAEEELLRLVGEAVARAAATSDGTNRGRDGRPVPTAHAAVRWANALVRIIDSPTDVATIQGWGAWIAASPGAVRNWCYTAGISPRRSLVFGRLLRAVILSEGGRHKPENVLNIVDRRTLAGLVAFAGLDAGKSLPHSAEEFMEHQTLVRDQDTLRELRRALRGKDTADEPR
jgi:CheY-like chemotaxis protein